jgi:peptidoglycan/LPS O-acetylase OafA/YrhL
VEGSADPAVPAGRIQFLDCLRALAIGLVVLVHYERVAFPGGTIGVSIFFALSGYLITGMLLDQPRLDGPAVLRFLVRRFFRVYPPYIAAIALIIFASWALDPPRFAAILTVLPRLLTFDSDIPGLGVSIGIFWTLQVEFTFYLLVPLLMLAVGRGHAFVVALAALLVLSLWLRFDLATLGALPARLRPFASFDILILGAFAALAVRSVRPARLPPFATASRLILIALLCIALFVHQEDPATWSVAVLAGGLLAAAWIYLQQQTASTADRPLLAWLGRISYSLYLVHAIPLDLHLLPAGWTQYGAKFGLLLFSVFLAWLLHIAVERPAIHVGRRLGARIGGPRLPAAGLARPARIRSNF